MPENLKCIIAVHAKLFGHLLLSFFFSKPSAKMAYVGKLYATMDKNVIHCLCMSVSVPLIARKTLLLARFIDIEDLCIL